MAKYCNKCGYKLVKNGKRKLKYRNEIQQYLCKKCRNYQSDNDFPWMKYPEKVARTASLLYHKSMPLKDVRYCINKIFGINVKSNSVIWYWARRFPLKSTDERFKELSDMLHLDDTRIKTNRKGETFCMWAIKDPKTKAMVTHVSKDRNADEAKKLLEKAKRRFPVGYRPKAIRTDSFPGYHKAIMHAFDFQVKQDRFRSFESHSNNEIETEFRCKRRFPRFRVLESAMRFVESYETNRNMEKLGDFLAWIFGSLNRMFWPMFRKSWSL